MWTLNPPLRGFRWLARILAGRGLIDEHRGRRIADLAWPRFVTMIARFSLRLSDISMVGLAVGSSAIVGISFAIVYWQFAFAFSIGIAGGTIGLVAQHYSADRTAKTRLLLTQSLLLALTICLPFVIGYWFGAESLIGVFTNDPQIVRYGSSYLRVGALAIPFVTVNVVASRALAGADDTWLPMSIRTTGALLNIGLNAVLVFGFQLGVVGAAVGSVIAEAFVSLCFLWGFVRGRIVGFGSFPVQIARTRPVLDSKSLRRLVRFSAPLVVQRLGQIVIRFPLLALLAVVGPMVVAAFEVARRVRNVLNAFGAGFSMSVSSLVGQAIGRADERQAVDYGRDTLTFSLVVYALASAVVFALAPLVAQLFSTDSETVSRTTPFVRVASISFLGLGTFRTFEGILKGSGENRWTMYGRLFGLYALLLPLTYVGATTSWGRTAVYVALIAETWGAALVTGYRVVTDQWTATSGTAYPSSAD